MAQQRGSFQSRREYVQVREPVMEGELNKQFEDARDQG
jgi:hypothetical protein